MLHPQLQQHLNGFAMQDEEEEEEDDDDEPHHQQQQEERNDSIPPERTTIDKALSFFPELDSSHEKSLTFDLFLWSLASVGGMTLVSLLVLLLLPLLSASPNLCGMAETNRNMMMMMLVVISLVSFLLGRQTQGGATITALSFSSIEHNRRDSIHGRQAQKSEKDEEFHQWQCRIQAWLGSIEAPPLQIVAATSTYNNHHVLSSNHYENIRLQAALESMVQGFVQYLQASEQCLHLLAHVTAWPYSSSQQRTPVAFLLLSSKWEQKENLQQRLPSQRLRCVLWQQLTQLRNVMEEISVVDDHDANGNQQDNHCNHNADNNNHESSPVLTLAVLRQAWMNLRQIVSGVTQQQTLLMTGRPAPPLLEGTTMTTCRRRLQKAAQQAALARAYLVSHINKGVPDAKEQPAATPLCRDLAQVQDVVEKLHIGLHRLADQYCDNAEGDQTRTVTEEWDQLRRVFDKLALHVEQLEATHFATPPRCDQEAEPLVNNPKPNTTVATTEELNEFTSMAKSVALQKEGPPVHVYDPTSTLVFSGEGRRGDNAVRATKRKHQRHIKSRHLTVRRNPPCRPMIDPLVAELNLVAELRSRLEVMSVAPEVQVTTAPCAEDDDEGQAKTSPSGNLDDLTILDNKQSNHSIEEEDPPFPSSALVLNELAAAIQLHKSTQE